jgi:hypothetical protein
MRPHSPAQHGYHAQPNTPMTPNSPRKQAPGAGQGTGHDAQQPDLLLQLLQGLSSPAPSSPLASPTAATPGAVNHHNSAFNRLLAAGNAGMDAGSLMAALQAGAAATAAVCSIACSTERRCRLPATPPPSHPPARVGKAGGAGCQAGARTQRRPPPLTQARLPPRRD